RDAWLRALSQLRVTLDLPSRHELAELSARLEALDARLAAMAAEQLSARHPAPALAADSDAAPVPVVEAAPPPVVEVVADADAEADADPDADTDTDAEGEADEAAAPAVTGQSTASGPRRHRKGRKNNRR